MTNMGRYLLTLGLLLLPVIAESAVQVNFVAEFPQEKPLRIAVDSDGKMYITGRNGTVSIKGQDGNQLLQLQEKDARGESLLEKPAGIAIDGNYLYVTDTSNDRVVIFSRNGSFLDYFGEGGSGRKNFSNPRGIYVRRGIIYVADYGNNRIQVFGPNGVFQGEIGTTGEDEARLAKPTDVVVDVRGTIYAIDSGSRVVKMYRQNGDYLGKVDGIVNPQALAITDNGLFVSDLENCSIVKFALTGERLFSFGSMGSGKVQFEEVTGLFVDRQGTVYLADLGKETVQIVSTEAVPGDDPLDQPPPPTSVRWQRDINLDLRRTFWDKAGEKLYGVNEDENAVLVIDLREGTVGKTITVPDWNPVAIAVDRKNALWVVDRSDSRLYKLDQQGKPVLTVGDSGSRPGYFSKPMDIAVTGDGMVYVADTGNDRIQIFDTQGVFHNVLGGGKGLPELQNPVALALDAKGNLYVLSETYSMVFAVSPEGHIIGRYGGRDSTRGRLDEPVAISVNGSELMVLDAGSSSIKVYSLKGEFLREFGAKGKGKGDFRKPSALTFVDQINILVSDNGNKRVQELVLAYTPPPPRDLAASAGMRTVELTWKSSPEPYIEKFRIYRAKGTPAGFKEIATIKTRTYQDNDLNPGVPYHYRVSAIARDGNEAVAAETVKALPARYRTSAPQQPKAQSQEWSVDLQWAPNQEPYLSHYRIYRADDEKAAEPKEVGETKTTAFSEAGLEANTSYVYWVAAVSTDGVESDRTMVKVQTLVATKPPLSLEIISMSDIFSNTYKIYENEGIARLKLTNNTRDRIAALKVSLSIKEFMDFPTEVEVSNLAPAESRELNIKAVFNNKILEVTEDTPVQSEISATYYENQKPRTITKNHTVNLYEKHRMMWVEKDRIATFVTSKDPVLLEFTRAVVTQYSDIGSLLVYAAALFENLGRQNMTYLLHPNNPYQVKAGKTEVVDYVQYPRETLKRNSGVCTDLVVLYSAGLESLGIRTMILGVPGHLFMMFALGPVAELGEDTMNGMLAIHDGYVWAPVELTVVGSSFMKAWELGSKAYNDGKQNGLELTDLTKAWGRYKPATLPFTDWRYPVASRSDVDKQYSHEVAKLNRITLKFSANRYLKVLQQNPNDFDALMQLGILYGEGGETEEAMKFFQKAESSFPNNPVVKNNIGNMHYLRGDFKEAVKAYENAAELDKDDPYILVNLTKCYLNLDMKDKAGEAFKNAYARDRDVAQQFRAMALELLGDI